MTSSITIDEIESEILQWTYNGIVNDEEVEKILSLKREIPWTCLFRFIPLLDKWNENKLQKLIHALRNARDRLSKRIEKIHKQQNIRNRNQISKRVSTTTIARLKNEHLIIVGFLAMIMTSIKVETSRRHLFYIMNDVFHWRALCYKSQIAPAFVFFIELGKKVLQLKIFGNNFIRIK